MNFMSIAHYTAFLLYIGLIAFILIKNPKALQNQACALLIGCFAVWSLASSFIYAAESRENATFWLNIASLGGYSFASFYLWFAHILPNKDRLRQKWPFYALIFLIPVLLISEQWSGNMAHIVKQTGGFAVIWPPCLWTWLFYTYYISFVLSSFWLSLGTLKKAKLNYEKKRIKLIVSTGIIALVLGTLNALLAPRLKTIHIPQMGSIITLIWAAGITYAITRYKLLVPTPAYAAADILRTMTDSLILIGPDGKLIEANAATLKLLGYTREEIIGRPVEALLKTTDLPFTNSIELLEQLIRLKTFKNYQFFYHAKNGILIPVSISGSVLRDQDDTLIGIVGVARDLREILRLEANERAYMMEKARTEALEEQARELQQAYQQLQTIQAQLIQSEKMAAVGQLAGGVAHEINNPMGVILGFAQSVAKRIPEDHQFYLPLKSIEREAERCKKLVNDLLTFSRAGKSQTELIDVNGAIDQTLSLIEIQTKIKNIEVRKNYRANLPPLLFNKNQLQQVIMNLCNNAIDAMPDGGSLTIITGHLGPWLEITIRDTGHGMTEAVKQRLFEPFFTTKEAGQGTGLGLSLCDEIIRKHHGIIEVESDLGQGSAFKLKLPWTETLPDPQNEWPRPSENH